MSMPGWYPDPAGASGRYRWWDGRTWSAETTTDPRSTPPRAPGAPGAPAGQSAPTARRGRSWPWVVGLVGFVVVLGLVGWFVLRPLLTSVVGGGTDPGGTSSQEICPPQSGETPSLPAQPNDGRVHGGPLSYPRLGSPWSAPQPQTDIPFGREVAMQDIVTDDEPPWRAGVFVARLMAGDGFFGPEEGSKIVVQCIVGTFYGNTDVTRADQRNTAVTVDGRSAWLVETHLTFQIEDLNTTGEWVMIVIVDIGDGSAGLFFASIPDNTPQYVAAARQAFAALKVTA